MLLCSAALGRKYLGSDPGAQSAKLSVHGPQEPLQKQAACWERCPLNPKAGQTGSPGLSVGTGDLLLQPAPLPRTPCELSRFPWSHSDSSLCWLPVHPSHILTGFPWQCALCPPVLPPVAAWPGASCPSVGLQTSFCLQSAGFVVHRSSQERGYCYKLIGSLM